MDIIDIYRAIYVRTSDYILFSSAHGTFSSLHHMLHHKTSLNKFNNIEIILSDHNSLKLEITAKKKEEEEVKTSTNIWRLNVLLKNYWVKEK